MGWWNKLVRRKKQKEQITLDAVALKTEKEKATAANEPWVGVLGMDVDINTLDQGSFELDWNDQFIAKLSRAGYAGKTDNDLVDQWFQSVCRNIVMESYEKEEAMRGKQRDDEERAGLR